uniref:Ig-like domain-containing protein n=1 Tax=Romanomermis culicivorax TaxID=13658 RepID=A0A915KVH0_ROMCU
MVTTESVIGYDTSAQHPSSNDRIQSFASSISEVVRQTEKHYDRTEEPQISIREPPRFIQRFSESVKLREGANCRLDCKFIPTNDPRMEIVWLYNNKPIHA